LGLKNLRKISRPKKFKHWGLDPNPNPKHTFFGGTTSAQRSIKFTYRLSIHLDASWEMLVHYQ